jgi:hypothetical protein
MRVKSENGLLWRRLGKGWEVISETKADEIARQNGYVYAENFVNTYAGRVVELDYALRITEVSK